LEGWSGKMVAADVGSSGRKVLGKVLPADWQLQHVCSSSADAASHATFFPRCMSELSRLSTPANGLLKP